MRNRPDGTSKARQKLELVHFPGREEHENEPVEQERAGDIGGIPRSSCHSLRPIPSDLGGQGLEQRFT